MSPIDHSHLNTKFIVVEAGASIGETLERLFEAAGEDFSSWHVVITLDDERFAVLGAFDLERTLKDLGRAGLDMPLAAVDGLLLPNPAVDRLAMGIGEANRQAIYSPRQRLVIAEGEQIVGLLAEAERGQDLYILWNILYPPEQAMIDRIPKAKPAPAPRYANTCLTRPGDGGIVDAGTSLSVGARYDLRFDIGPLSGASVVDNSREHPVPVDLLPPSESGHWLQVVVVSDDFEVSRQCHDLFLPVGGASWVCDCSPVETHTCDASTRRPYLFVPLVAPHEPGQASLRLGLYYQNNLVQSQLLTAEIVEENKSGSGYSAHIDYTLSGKLADLGFLPPRTFNILTNQNADGTHRLVINGELDDVLAFNLSEGQMRDAIDAVRQGLQDVHFIDQTGPPLRRVNLFDPYNAKTKADFLTDILRLAPLGWRLWSMLRGSSDSNLRKQLRARLKRTATIQVSRTGGSNFVFPWSLVYDIPLESDSQYRPCRLLDEWDGQGTLVADDVSACPYETEHEMNVICPFGFWGYRHIIEQPPSVPGDRDLPLVIHVGDHPMEFVAGLSIDLDEMLTTEHFQNIRADLANFNVLEFASRNDLRSALANPDLEVVYFYCHGSWELLPGSTQVVTYLEVGSGERITPDDIFAWDEGAWPAQHWQQTSPLIFINGCHTTDLIPEALVNFVDAFASVYAAGVIGTEIAIHQRVASEVAEAFFYSFKDNAPAALALQKMRLHLLSKGNLLGLAYTAYCSADLRLAEN